jgi:outer membrane protein assembly factor BamA
MSRSLDSTKHSIRFLFSLTLLVVVCASVFAQEAKVEQRPVLDLTGNKVFSKPELLDVINSQLDKWARNGARYESAMLTYSVHQAEQFIKSQGYLQVRLTTGSVEQTEAGPRVLITAVEGPRYRVGKMTVENSQLLTAEQVLEEIGLKTGDIANGAKVSDGVFQRLKQRYGKFGYITYSAEIQPTFHAAIDDADSVVDFKITIAEGEQFAVRSIKIEGADKTVTQALTRELLLRAGDIYDDGLFRESITRMNRTGLVAPIDSEKDVSFVGNKRKTDGQSVLDLVILVKQADTLSARQQ